MKRSNLKLSPSFPVSPFFTTQTQLSASITTFAIAAKSHCLYSFATIATEMTKQSLKREVATCSQMCRVTIARGDQRLCAWTRAHPKSFLTSCPFLAKAATPAGCTQQSHSISIKTVWAFCNNYHVISEDAAWPVPTQNSQVSQDFLPGSSPNTYFS